MEKLPSDKQAYQCIRIFEFAEASELTDEEKSILKEAICEYFPIEVTDKVLAELALKSRSK
ncbi:hypothetical protein ACYUFO_004028 [Vibrio parahaemolyticus]